jgi:hypothetical protein
MIRPRGSSPHRSLALVLALTGIRASKPFSLVHITSQAPSMLIALVAKTPYRMASCVQAAIGLSSYWPPLVISTKTMRAGVVTRTEFGDSQLEVPVLAHAAVAARHVWSASMRLSDKT